MSQADQAQVGASCDFAGQGAKCAIVSWVAPLLAIGILLLSLRYPVAAILDLVAVAFGITALARSIAHIRRFGGCGLGGHVALGIVLNAIVVALLGWYLFVGIDATFR